MKYLSLILLFNSLLLACQNDRFRPLEDYEFETVTWRLRAIQTWDDIGNNEVRLVDSDRTLQFWNGVVRSNGSFCDLDGDSRGRLRPGKSINFLRSLPNGY